MNNIEKWFNPIFDENYKRIFQLVRQALVKKGISETAELAEDITQKTFLTLLLKREKVLGYSNISAWLVVTAKNHLKNELELSKYEMEVPYPEKFEPADRERGENVRFVLPSGLTKEERKLLTLLAEGYKPKDIAEMSGITPAACRMRLKRAREHCIHLLLGKK